MRIPRPMPLRSMSLEAWGFALLALLIALGFRFAFIGVAPTGVAFSTFIPALILITYFSGFWPAVAATVIAAIAGWYFFLPPGWSFELSGSAAASIGPFLGIAVVAIAIIYFIRTTLDALDAERLKSEALAEQREILFRELQHRVSNNLAIVSALLNLQRATIDDERAKQALTEAATRLALIAKIHRKLRDPSGAQLRFGPFVEDLCRDVLDASGAGNIVCLVSAAEAIIPDDKLVPVALIVTELISNALEHGFSGRPNGTIRIDLTPEGTDHILTVTDDGNGLPANFTLDTAGLGLRIVQSLAQQIQGRFVIETGRGTTCRLVFQASSLASA